MIAVERFIAALDADGRKVVPRARGYSAQCPAHDDHNPSLTVTPTEGQVLIFCHAGCTPDAVVNALGLKTQDLFDSPKGVAYRYDDGRIVQRSPGKRFTQKNTGGRPTLYRLGKVREAVAAGIPVFIVEGEKDVHALESVGVVATTNPMGSVNWPKVDVSPLDGARVVVIADKDSAGLKWRGDVVDSLGTHATVELRSARVGKDAADHLAAGLGVDDLVPDLRPAAGTRAHARQVTVTWANTIAPKAVEWAWVDGTNGRIPSGSLAVFAGREGTGKSSFALWVAAQITRGKLPGSNLGSPRTVFIAATEDSWQHTLVPRLMAADADLSRVARIDVSTEERDAVVLSLPDDIAALEAAIRQHAVGMVILDPLMSMIGEGIDTHRAREVRIALDPLAQLADRTGTVIAGIAHFNKSSGSDAASLITGSGAFKDVPRSVFGFARDDDGRVMTQVKNSLGRDELPSTLYTIETVGVPVAGGSAEVGRFTPLGESDRTVRDVLRDDAGNDDDRQEQRETVDWLRSLLDDHNGEISAGDAIKAADREGIAKRTLQRARVRAGIIAKRVGGRGGSWVWRLPVEGATEDAEGANRETAAPTASSVSSSTATAAETSAGTCPGCGVSTVVSRAGHDSHCGECSRQTVR